MRRAYGSALKTDLRATETSPVTTTLATPSPRDDVDASAASASTASTRWAAARRWGADACVVAALAWWATWLTWGTGGREPQLVSTGCLLVAAAWLLVRPDRVLPALVLGLGGSLALGAVAVVLTSPTGWAGRDDAAAWVLAAATGLLLLAWATGDVRRLLLLGTLVGAAGAQFAQGWLPWWGGQDPAKLFQGTFYWHNQVGIFLAAGALLALAVLAHGGPLAPLGWVVAPLAVAGTVFSTSRGSQLGLALGVVLLLVLAGRGVAVRVRLLAGAGAAAATTWALTGPPFFAERVDPLAGTEARAESFVGNGVTRLEDWAAAWQVFERWPLTGGGFDGFRSATVATGVGDRAGQTAYAHNGFLQALTDGGLLLGLPLLAATVAFAAGVLRALPAAVRAGDLVQVGAATTLLVLALHSGMDFDWAYPSLLLMVPLVAALALPPLGAVEHRRSRPLRVLGAVVPVVLLVAAAVAAWGGGLSLNAPVG